MLTVLFLYICFAVDGGFSNWGNWSKCNVMCGKGIQVRSRVCNSPLPSDGGRACIGPYTQGLPCGLSACAGSMNLLWCISLFRAHFAL